MNSNIESDRTIIVDEPRNEVGDNIEEASRKRDNAEENNSELDVKYFEEYLTHLHGRLDQLEEDGLSEQELLETHHATSDEWSQIEEATVDNIELVAERDATQLILVEFFGHGPTELADIVNQTVYDDDTVELTDMNRNSVRFTIDGEQQARQIADTFLRQAGTSLGDLERTHPGQMLD